MTNSRAPLVLAVVASLICVVPAISKPKGKPQPATTQATTKPIAVPEDVYKAIPKKYLPTADGWSNAQMDGAKEAVAPLHHRLGQADFVVQGPGDFTLRSESKAGLFRVALTAEFDQSDRDVVVGLRKGQKVKIVGEIYVELERGNSGAVGFYGGGGGVPPVTMRITLTKCSIAKRK